MNYESIIQRTWKDASFKSQLIANPKAVLGLNGEVEVQVHDDSAETMHFVLLSPSQLAQAQIDAKSIVGQVTNRAHADSAFKARLLSNAKAAVQEVIGVEAPANIVVHENTNEVIHIVLPSNPETTGELSDSDLAMVAGGKGVVINCATMSTGLNKGGGLMSKVGSLLPGNFGGLFSSLGPILTGGANVLNSASSFLGSFGK